MMFGLIEKPSFVLPLAAIGFTQSLIKSVEPFIQFLILVGTAVVIITSAILNVRKLLKK